MNALALTVDWTRVSDLEAERAVLGCMTLDKPSIAIAMGVLRAGDFYDPRNAVVFDAITSIDHNAYEGSTVDIRVVVDALRARNVLNTIGGAQYLGELSDSIVSFTHLENHAAIVRNYAGARRAIEKMQAIGAKVLAGQHDPTGIASELSTLAVDLTKTATSRSTVHVREILLSMWEDMGQEPIGAVTWQHQSLTRRFGTLLPTETVLVSAEPAAGKSSLVLELAVHTAKMHGPVLYFVFEMSKAEMGRRITSQESHVDESKILGRVPFDEGDREAIADANNRLMDIPLRISDDTSVTISRMRAEIQHEKTRGGCVMVVIDYLQLVVCENPKASRVEQLDELSRGIKKMAQDFGIIVVVVSSLNDTGENQGAPKLRNLRGSRQLGFDANKVFMLANDGEEFDGDDPPAYRDVAMIASKNRGGAKNAKVRMRFHGPTYSFEPVTDEPEQSWGPQKRGREDAGARQSHVRVAPEHRAAAVAARPVSDGTELAEDDPVYARGGDGLPGVGEHDNGELYDAVGEQYS